MQKNCVLRWVYMYKIPDEACAQTHQEINDWLSSGQKHHLISQVFPLEEIAAAHELQESGKAIGTVIVNPEL